ncbi:TRAP transporter substrate-binding protein [Notoacmeibacter sp. MSK16QG-6]|uniref:TRAP transporter substrate-binding protein n=1 Tax=Notoacmeibacter sp. MSK16QG-6 TaxID=2957982 RepID=UPI00209E11C9|nr:TRAP transporter substrate-binding protein [Notoacmeibacter sp. MSK16QG-6]MCP1198317.1 TRAP transporter substrate-binding protein [Notoacmeibacter sp. MSK16QG-6]
MLTRRTLIQTGAILGATLAMPHIARAASKTVRLGHASNEIHPGHKLAMSFKEALDEILPGAFDVTIFPNRQLGDDKQNLESAVAGTLEMAMVSGVLIPLVTGRPAYDAWQLPFLVRDYDHFEKLALSPIGQKMQDDLEPAGIIGLATADIGQRNFLSINSKVRTVADMKGLKTRIVPVPLHKAIWEALGTAPVGLPYGEVYGALETGVIDAVEINVSSMLGENLWEVGKNFTLTGHYPWHASNVVSTGFWNTLSDEEKEAMREAGRRSVSATLAYAKEQDLSGRDELREKGVEIIELENLAEMQETVAPLTAEWAKKDPLIAEFVEAARANS